VSTSSSSTDKYWQPLPRLLFELSDDVKRATPDSEKELRAAYANVLQAINGAFELSLRRSIRSNTGDAQRAGGVSTRPVDTDGKRVGDAGAGKQAVRDCQLPASLETNTL